jgi:hypothetical protein
VTLVPGDVFEFDDPGTLVSQGILEPFNGIWPPVELVEPPKVLPEFNVIGRRPVMKILTTLGVKFKIGSSNVELYRMLQTEFSKRSEEVFSALEK